MSEQKEIKIHSIKYNFVMNMILKMSTFVFPLITFPYISRVLGPEGNGKVSFASSVIYYFTVVASLGIPTYGIRVCAKHRDDREKLSRTVHELLIINLVLTALTYGVMLILVFGVPRLRNDVPLLLVSSASLVLTGIGVEWFYQAIEQYDYITWRNILFKVLSIVAMFIWVKRPEDYIVYAGVQVFGNVGANVLNLVRLRRYIDVRPMKDYQVRQHLRPAVIFFLLTVATTIYTNLDTVMLGFMSGDVEVGYYSVAIKVKAILTGMVAALGTVVLPRTSYYLQNQMVDAFREIIEKSFKVVCMLALPLMLYCMVQAEHMIIFLAGGEYIPAVPTMVVIMPTILLIGLSNIIGLQVLVPLGKERYTILSTVAGAVTDVIFNMILIPQYGALGAAIGTLLAEMVVLVVQIGCVWKSSYVRVDGKDLLKVVLAGIVAVVGLGIYDAYTEVEHVFLEIMCSAVLFFSVYGFALLILKEDLVMQYLVKPLKRKNKKEL